MDIASIPKVESVVLTGLDFSMRPANVRYELSKGFITPLRENRVTHLIKGLAVMVYNQEKFTPLYHANVCETRNPLAYFICAVHRQAAPQPQKMKDRHASISSNASSNSGSSCTCTVPGEQCELPQLCTDSALPLGYWDGLYYALVSEIRRLHADLQERFGWVIENGTQPLHYNGVFGTSKESVTPIELASILESAWYYLMDNRLVAALDDAVRMRKIRENAAKKHNSTSTKASSDGDSNDEDDEGKQAEYERPPVVEGLVDVNGMSAEDITEMLWEKYALEVDQVCAKEFEDESMLTVYQAAIHRQSVERSQVLDLGPPPSSTCHCHGKCICQLRCDIHISHCTCAPRAQVYHKVTDKHEEPSETEIDATFVKQDMTQKNHFIGNPTSVLRQMEMFPQKTSALMKAAQAPHNLAMAAKSDRTAPTRYKTRQRTNTNNSDLAYVPESKGSRIKGKDAYPLGFYNDGSPGRYPKLRQEASTISNDSQMSTAATGSNRMMARKPVPAPIVPVQPYIAPDAGHGVVTPPLDNRFNASGFTAARAHAAYAENARLHNEMLEKHGAVTQSFPTTAENPRKGVNSDEPFVDNPIASDPAHGYVGLLARHPSSLEQTEDATEPFPALSRSMTTTLPSITKAEKVNASTNDLPTLKSLGGNISKPMPPLPPLPEFIAPRPATVQRYVSAGGNAPLSQRTEIAGPAFHSTGFNTPLTHTSGASISKAEIDAKMSDPEWVATHFGAAAAERLSLSPPRKLRESDDSVAVVDSSQRSSRETNNRSSSGQQYNPRDRTSSGVSAGVAKFKRVFSRKNSTNESD